MSVLCLHAIGKSKFGGGELRVRQQRETLQIKGKKRKKVHPPYAAYLYF